MSTSSDVQAYAVQRLFKAMQNDISQVKLYSTHLIKGSLVGILSTLKDIRGIGCNLKQVANSVLLVKILVNEMRNLGICSNSNVDFDVFTWSKLPQMKT